MEEEFIGKDIREVIDRIKSNNCSLKIGDDGRLHLRYNGLTIICNSDLGIEFDDGHKFEYNYAGRLMDKTNPENNYSYHAKYVARHKFHKIVEYAREYTVHMNHNYFFGTYCTPSGKPWAQLLSFSHGPIMEIVAAEARLFLTDDIYVCGLTGMICRTSTIPDEMPIENTQEGDELLDNVCEARIKYFMSTPDDVQIRFKEACDAGKKYAEYKAAPCSAAANSPAP